MDTLHILSDFLKKVFVLSFLLILCIACVEIKSKDTKSIIQKNDYFVTANSKQNKQIMSKTYEKDPSKSKMMPESLNIYLKKQLPNYSLPKLNDYINGWEEYSNQKDLPFLCISDFNGDGVNDYAMLLLKDSIQVCLFSFHQNSNGYKHFMIECYGKVKGLNPNFS